MISFEPRRIAMPIPRDAATGAPASRTIRQPAATGQSAADAPASAPSEADAALLETHWTRILYCDLLSPAANGSEARPVMEAATRLARRAAIGATVCAGLYLAFTGLVFALR